MPYTKPSLQPTFQLIVDILSFDIPTQMLKIHFDTHTVDWDSLVVVGSEHLVLPSIYCRLQQKDLLHILPEDLRNYLEELTKLNLERNKVLLEEIQEISGLLKKNSIEHVFVKGSALLVGNYFANLAERMVGDIDILVLPQHIDKAFQLLAQHGYKQTVSFNYEVKNYRHKPRQISSDRLGAVELHSELLKHKYNHLLDKASFIKNKELINDVAIPSAEHILSNSIFAHQINDYGYFYNTIKLKALYDIMVVKAHQQSCDLTTLGNQKYVLGFFNIASIFHSELQVSKPSVFDQFKKRWFLYTINRPKFGREWYKLKYKYLGFKERLHLLLFNDSYRKHILKNKALKRFS